MTRTDRIAACVLACAVMAPGPIAVASITPHAVAHAPARVVDAR